MAPLLVPRSSSTTLALTVVRTHRPSVQTFRVDKPGRGANRLHRSCLRGSRNTAKKLTLALRSAHFYASSVCASIRPQIGHTSMGIRNRGYKSMEKPRRNAAPKPMRCAVDELRIEPAPDQKGEPRQVRILFVRVGNILNLSLPARWPAHVSAPTRPLPAQLLNPHAAAAPASSAHVCTAHRISRCRPRRRLRPGPGVQCLLAHPHPAHTLHRTSPT